MAYSSSTAFTITLNSLGSASARESTSVDNSSNLYKDAHVRVTANVGSVSGAPQVVVWAYGSEDGTVYPDTVTGSDAAITLESPTVLGAPAAVIPCPTSSKAYESNVISIARLFGGALPRKWGIVVRNDTGAAFAGSGCSASWTGIS